VEQYVPCGYFRGTPERVSKPRGCFHGTNSPPIPPHISNCTPSASSSHSPCSHCYIPIYIYVPSHLYPADSIVKMAIHHGSRSQGSLTRCHTWKLFCKKWKQCPKTLQLNNENKMRHRSHFVTTCDRAEQGNITRKLPSTSHREKSQQKVTQKESLRARVTNG
jgi:hypothetical protein